MAGITGTTLEGSRVNVVKVISTHKRAKGHWSHGVYVPARPIKKGCKRVMAICGKGKHTVTRHVDIAK